MPQLFFNKEIGEIIRTRLNGIDEGAIFIQSPLTVIIDNKRIVMEFFTFWVEYYQHYKWLNNSYKIIVIGGDLEYSNLPYYLIPCQVENIWHRIDKLIIEKEINYSKIPSNFLGKERVDAFFYGHGDGNIKGVLGKIADFLRNGILMLREGETIAEVKEIFFNNVAAHLEQLKSRLEKYRPFLEYLPWEQEIVQLDKMIAALETWLKQPNETLMSHDEILNQVKMAFESISQLMKIHKIK